MKTLLFKTVSLILVFCIFSIQQLWSQCTPGDLLVTTDDLVVNTYYPGTTASVPMGSKFIDLGVPQGNIASIAKGDLVLIIQMQGSAINSSNDDTYGSGMAGIYSGITSSIAGAYEYAIAANAVSPSGGRLYLAQGTINSYTNADYNGAIGQFRYQVIRVPRYNNVIINTGNELITAAWNGATGGVLAFDAINTLQVNGTFVRVDAQGFRGGGGAQIGGANGAPIQNTAVRFSWLYTNSGAKGEGIAGTPLFVRTAGTLNRIDNGVEGYPEGSFGKGAPGNAGGGGTDGIPMFNFENSGGGGGANGGNGGRGGRPWKEFTLDNGGYGGSAPSFLTTSRLILGGGGGAGGNDNGTDAMGNNTGGIHSSGGAGGGMVLIRAGAISGTGTISANGENGGSVAYDGAGGGGAGGTVYITATSGLENITVLAIGGNGGSAWATQPDDDGIADNGSSEYGPGGGGGGGMVYSNGTLNAASSVAGGVNGTTLTDAQPYGSTPGVAGTVNAAALLINSPFNTVCSADIDNDKDGIADVAETVGSPVGPFGDEDNDDIVNVYDATPGGTVPVFTDANGDGANDAFDSDRDGVINAFDLDSDNDGIPDIVEAGGVDSNNDGIADTITDTDGDGLVDSYDSDNGGTAIGSRDKDRDMLPDWRDLDADGDGIVDVREAGLPDSDNNGIVDGVVGTDGWSDIVDALASLTLPNTDSRGPVNYLDIDSDEDGLTDNIEGQATAMYILPTGIDNDGDGIDDAYDNNNALFGGSANNGILPVNSDGLDLVDYMDTDSDNDGASDLREGNSNPSMTLTNTADTDDDGLVDQFDVFNRITESSFLYHNVVSSGMGAGGSSTGPVPAGTVSLANRTGSGSDWRDQNVVTLPVDFISIAAVKKENSVVVTWEVANEKQVIVYDIEKSNDGLRFEKIGQVIPIHTFATRKQYRYEDLSVIDKIAYYRIRENSLLNTYAYSNVVKVSASKGYENIRLYPNPITTSSRLELKVSYNQTSALKIVDVTGKVYGSKTYTLKQGVHQIMIEELNDLPKGQYLISIQVDGQWQSFKFSKV